MKFKTETKCVHIRTNIEYFNVVKVQGIRKVNVNLGETFYII